MNSEHESTQQHTAFQTLPVVDVAQLSSEHFEERMACAQQLGQAASDAGFLYIKSHGVAPELIDKLKRRVRDYFARPEVEKMQDYIGQSCNHSGYVPQGEEQFYAGSVDCKEAYDIGFDMQEPQFQRPMLGPNQWPEIEGFRADVQAYYQAVLELGARLFRGFALALNLPEDYFDRFLHRPPSQLRLIHYPYNPQVPPDGPGIGAHTDYECFTILLPTAPGLEVLNGAGQWIDVPVMEDAFVINIGDMMEILSNGVFVATSHRVRKVAEERYSFPMFCNLDYDTRIEPIESLVKSGASRAYRPVVCGEHLYAQTLQTFAYLKQRLANGEVELPKDAQGLAFFGREAGAKT